MFYPWNHSRGTSQPLRKNRILTYEDSASGAPRAAVLSWTLASPLAQEELGFPLGPGREDVMHSPAMLHLLLPLPLLGVSLGMAERSGEMSCLPRIALPFIEASPTHPN